MGAPRREFTRSEYRRGDRWQSRIRREAPLLERVLRESPPRGIVLDAGCGTGEHARFFAERGNRVLAVDHSRAALERAVSLPVDGTVSWVRGDLRALPLGRGVARAAFCLGNTLVILGEDEAIRGLLETLGQALLPGGVVLLQILNYRALRSGKVRNLPLNFRRLEDPSHPSGELVYLRLMDFDEPRHVSFHVITLQRRAGSDEVTVHEAVRRRLRSLEYDELEELLRIAGFRDVQLLGDYSCSPFDPVGSSDVIAMACRE